MGYNGCCCLVPGISPTGVTLSLFRLQQTVLSHTGLVIHVYLSLVLTRVVISFRYVKRRCPWVERGHPVRPDKCADFAYREIAGTGKYSSTTSVEGVGIFWSDLSGGLRYLLFFLRVYSCLSSGLMFNFHLVFSWGSGG